MPRKNKRSCAKKEQWKLRTEHLVDTVEKAVSNNCETAIPISPKASSSQSDHRISEQNKGSQNRDNKASDKDDMFKRSEGPLSSNSTSYKETDEISVRASYSQSDYRFSEYTRGTQCVANSLMFLAHLNETQHINRDCLNCILNRGDQLYGQIRHRLEDENRFISRYLNFDDLPDTIETDSGRYVVKKSNPVGGLLLQDAPEDWQNFLNLSLRLEGLGTEFSQALLIIGGLCVSVFKDRSGRYGFFDPHSRNANGSCCDKNGKAVMVTFHFVSDLANRLIQLFFCSLKLKAHHEYNLLPVCFEREISEDLKMGIMSTESEPDVVQESSMLPKVSIKLDKLRREKVAKRLTRLEMSKRNQELLNEKKQKKLRMSQRRKDADKNRYRLHSSEKAASIRARYGEDCAFQLRQKQYIRGRYNNDSSFKQKQKEHVKDRYRNDPAFQQKQKEHIKDRYRNDPAFQQKQKEHIKDRYRKDPAFQQKQKEHIKDRYRKDPAFQQKQKEHIKDRYRKDPAFQQKQKEHIKDRYRKDPAFQQKQKEHIKDRYRKDPAFQQKQKEHIKDRYRKDPAFQQKQKEHIKDRYRKDLAFQEKQKEHIKGRYKNDPAFQQKQKEHIRSQYRNDPAFQMKKKENVRGRYRNDPAFQMKKKENARGRYRNDPAFQMKKKENARGRYRNDPALQQKKKEHIRGCYRNNTAFQLKQKAYMKAHFKKHYEQDARFQERRRMSQSRHFKLRQTKDLKALHSIRCSNRIKEKYRSIFGFTTGQVNRELSEPTTVQRTSDTQSNQLIQQAQSLFALNVQQGPIYICTVCHRCLFANQVRLCESSNYSKDPELTAMCLTGTYVHVCEDSCRDQGECIMPERKEEWICHSCHENLKTGHLPSIAVSNNLELDPIPNELQGLNVLERHIIAKFIPFAKIIALPKGQQRAIHGAVVCVPSEVESTVQCLPRPPSESQLLRVKLKRRLQYKGHFQFQNLDMKKVRTALMKLKEIHSEYREVAVREEEEEEYLDTTECAMGENVAESVANDDCSNNEEHAEGGSDSENTSDKLEDSIANNVCTNQDDGAHGGSDSENACDEQDNSVAGNYGIAFDSCLQPADVGQEILSFGDNVYSIAPAEGNQPVSFFKTPKLESMAFPVQFNTGRNTLDESDRPKKISPSRYFNARLFSADNRFAMDTNYIFFAQFVAEMHAAMSSMSIQLRKGKAFTKDGRRITTRVLQDQREVQKLVQHGEATRFMQPLRGTPAFWEKTMRDLFACLRQLGLPTFFCTFSAAEMRWPEIIGAIKKQQGETVNFSELDWSTKCDILRSNPVTVIRLFEKRVEALMRDLILSPAQPIGEVVDMFYRVEFQARGSAHIHCLFWIKDAPKFEDDPDEKVSAFIDKYISCQLPDEKSDPDLHNIVKEVQSHSKSHTKSCKKGKKHCRFGFPKPPVKSTFISRPRPSDPDGPSPNQQARTKLKPVWDLLHDSAASFQSTDDILAKCNMTYNDFSRYLEMTTDSSAVMMKRDPKDCWVNGYNPHLLRAWNANMDIQYILNPYSCIIYMLSYITKAEHEMSDYLKRIVKESSKDNSSELEQMKEIMQAYSKNREVSVQEAVTRVCSLKLKSCSRSVIFIPTDDNAVKMSLPLRKLETKDPDSDQVWMAGLPEKYKARPETPEFETMCMADFASNYRLVYGRQSGGPNVIPLQDNMGFIQKRTKGKPAVIRYARFSQRKDPEKFYGSLLKVYLPYRDEHQLKIPPFNSYQCFYESACIKLSGSESLRPVFEIVNDNRKRYEKDSDAIERAIEDFEKIGPTEDAWANFAPNTELIRIETISEHQPVDPAEDKEQDDVPEYRKNSERTTAVQLVECPALSSKVLRQMYQNLNETQAAVFYKLRDWSLRLVNGERPDQFFYFVTGGAGTGKSHLIKCVYNEVTKILRRLPSMDELDDLSRPTVLLTSFTGTASFNISGNTLHSVLKLPKNLKPPYQGLGNSLDEMRIILSNVQIIVIDEISMVSKELFAYVDQRLQQIKGSKKPFGGVSVLAVGDFFQLPPVGKAKALCVYEDNTMDIWKDNFHIITLEEIMRQKQDAPFAEMLNRLRVKKKTEPLLNCDRALLATRIFPNKSDCPPDVLHIFATNKEVDKHNNDTLSALSFDITRIDAEDHMKDDRTGRMVRQAAPFQGRKGDLPDSLLLSEGVRVVITRNIDTGDGLVNGTFAKISQIVKKTDTKGNEYVDLIGLELDNPTAGAKRRSRIPGSSDNVVFIERVEERCKRKGLVRCQFPLKLAYACTSHKVQGMTSSAAVVSLKRIFEPGMAYVALSRTTSLQGLHIIDFEEKKIFCNEEVLNSLESMPKANVETVMPLLMHAKTAASDCFTVIHHNVEGLHCHFDDMRKHHEICLGDILCFTETHMFGLAVPEELQIEGYNMYKRNRQVSYSSFPQLANQKGGGVAIYAKNHINAQVLQYVMGVTDMEFLALKIRDPVQAVVAAIYKPPNYKTADFLSNLNSLLDAIDIMDQDHVIICGDFNEDLRSTTSKSIYDLFTRRGYTQLIQGATTEKNTSLDLIYTSQPQKCLSSGVLHSYYSYHNPVYAVIKE